MRLSVRTVTGCGPQQVSTKVSTRQPASLARLTAPTAQPPMTLPQVPQRHACVGRSANRELRAVRCVAGDGHCMLTWLAGSSYMLQTVRWAPGRCVPSCMRCMPASQAACMHACQAAFVRAGLHVCVPGSMLSGRAACLRAGLHARVRASSHACVCSRASLLARALYRPYACTEAPPAGCTRPPVLGARCSRVVPAVALNARGEGLGCRVPA